jgi:hypothetical protein
MSPVTSSRYRVTALDYSRYEIAVEARGETDAVRKAQTIYGFHGSYDEFEATSSTVRWMVMPLAEEAHQ